MRRPHVAWCAPLFVHAFFLCPIRPTTSASPFVHDPSSHLPPPFPPSHHVRHHDGRVSCVLSPIYCPVRASTTTLWPTPATAAVASSPSSRLTPPDGGKRAWCKTIECRSRRRVRQDLRSVERLSLRWIILVRPHYWRVLLVRVVSGETTCAGVEWCRVRHTTMPARGGRRGSGGHGGGESSRGGGVFQLPNFSPLQGSLPAWPTTAHFSGDLPRVLVRPGAVYFLPRLSLMLYIGTAALVKMSKRQTRRA